MSNKHYWVDKENRIKKAEDWVVKMDEEHAAEIANCVKNTIVFSEDAFDKTEVEIKNSNSKIILTPLDSVSAVFKYAPEGHTAVLNFASYKEPGGMFLQGSKAQEECLCHESVLYNVLREQEDYYTYNRKHLNKALYQNRALYSPDIYFERGNESVFCDVITCAAPNYTAASKYCNVSQSENSDALTSRIKYILDIATSQKVEILILGAFGCGVFGQNATDVAQITKTLLKNYAFRKVVLAVIDKNSENYNAFKTIFSEN